MYGFESIVFGVGATTWLSDLINYQDEVGGEIKTSTYPKPVTLLSATVTCLSGMGTQNRIWAGPTVGIWAIVPRVDPGCKADSSEKFPKT